MDTVLDTKSGYRILTHEHAEHIMIDGLIEAHLYSLEINRRGAYKHKRDDVKPSSLPPAAYHSFEAGRPRRHCCRLKAFNILGGRFRHGTSVEHRMELHRMAVDAIVGVIQYNYENGHPPFDVC